MDAEEVKRGRGRGRGTRARGRGRGRRGRGKKNNSEEAAAASLDESSNLVMEDSPQSGNLEHMEDSTLHDLDKEHDAESNAMVVTEEISSTTAVATTTTLPNVEGQSQTVLPPPIDMEADISQLEAPTFTTISRGPPEPMLRLKWSHKVNLIGEKVLNPMIHCCDQCDKPILVYGRMIPCKHVFCLKCARAEPIKNCPRCSDKVVRVEQSGLGTVFMCTHGGSRYGRTGCRRTYLSQRDLQAHINHRHVTQTAVMSAGLQQQVNELKLGDHGALRKISESSTTTAASSVLMQQRTSRGVTTSGNLPVGIGNIAPPGSSVSQNAALTHSTLTQANLARINNANAQDCHQGKVSLHQSLKKGAGHQQSEAVADASYYSSVLNSFGSAGGGGGPGSAGTGSTTVGGVNAGNVTSTGSQVLASGFDATNIPSSSSASSAWQQSQYYR